MSNESFPDRDRTDFAGVVRPIEPSDIETLKPILETWLRDPTTGDLLTDEVDEVVQAMAGTPGSADFRQYLVAENEKGVVGVMGLAPVSPAMKQYIRTRYPAELINAYVSEDERGTGVGTALLEGIEKLAVKLGCQEIVLNSGPRYKDTAWDFYTKRYGEPVGVAEGLYGPGRDAPVWSKIIAS